MSLDANGVLQSVQLPICVNKALLPKARIEANTSSHKNEIVALSASRVSFSVVPVLLPMPIDPNKTLDPNKTPVLSASRIP